MRELFTYMERHKMSTYKTIHHDLITGEVTITDYTPEQIAEVEARLATIQAEKEAAAKIAAAKTALLEKLGITEDEAKLLLS